MTSGAAAERPPRRGRWSLFGAIRAARRRMWRRRLAMLLATPIVGAAIGVALVVGGGGGSSSGSPSSATAAGTARAGTVLAPMVALRSWTGLASDVNPGSGVAFVSPLLGLVLSPTPIDGYDRGLSSGVGGLMDAWPSANVLVTRDGGRSFSPSLHVAGGFWGLDFTDPNHAWAVGVRGLYRTIDGGRGWHPAGEPSSPLVRVAFATNRKGFGLTVPGRLVTTTDGGRKWHPAGWPGTGAALCSVRSGSAIVATTTGSLWRVSAAGLKQIAPGYQRPVPGRVGWWPDLSCTGQNVVESGQAFCEASCGGEVDVDVRQSTNGGLSWRRITDQVTGDAGLELPPTALGPIWTIAVAGADRLCLVGADRWVTIRCGASHNAAVPPVRAGSPPMIQGAEFENATSGWVLVDQVLTAKRSLSSVWTTRDGGRTWSASSPLAAGQ